MKVLYSIIGYRMISWKKDYVYHIEDHLMGADFYVVVEYIDDREMLFPVHTQIIAGSGHEMFGSKWALEINHGHKEVGHRDDCPEYFL
jgi:hypothetical protein